MKALHRIFRVLTCFPVVLSLLLCPLLPERILPTTICTVRWTAGEVGWRFCCCRCAVWSAV